MAMLVKNTPQQPSQQEVLSGKYQSARHNILLIVVFTLINIVLLVTNSNTYFLFSASIPYMIVDIGMALCGKYPAEYYAGELSGMAFMSDTFFAITLAVAAVFLVLYLLSWIFSKKPRVGWMIFALVFFAIDTVGMLLLMGISTDAIMDIVFHGWVIFSLTNGIISYFKLKKLPEEDFVAEEPAQVQEAVPAVEKEENQ